MAYTQNYDNNVLALSVLWIIHPELQQCAGFFSFVAYTQNCNNNVLAFYHNNVQAFFSFVSYTQNNIYYVATWLILVAYSQNYIYNVPAFSQFCQ